MVEGDSKRGKVVFLQRERSPPLKKGGKREKKRKRKSAFYLGGGERVDTSRERRECSTLKGGIFLSGGGGLRLYLHSSYPAPEEGGELGGEEKEENLLFNFKGSRGGGEGRPFMGKRGGMRRGGEREEAISWGARRVRGEEALD